MSTAGSGRWRLPPPLHDQEPADSLQCRTGGTDSTAARAWVRGRLTGWSGADSELAARLLFSPGKSRTARSQVERLGAPIFLLPGRQFSCPLPRGLAGRDGSKIDRAGRARELLAEHPSASQPACCEPFPWPAPAVSVCEPNQKDHRTAGNKRPLCATTLTI